VTHAVEQNTDGWFGEGDDMMFIDGDALPTINGTGTEDYYNGAWDFYGRLSPICGRVHRTLWTRSGRAGAIACIRWHIESPITFEKSIRVTIEHGHANDRADNFYSTRIGIRRSRMRRFRGYRRRKLAFRRWFVGG